MILLRRYGYETSGATAVEFGMLAVPFFVLIMGIIELSLYYAAGVMLEGSAVNAARLIRTGEAQQSGNAQALFEDAMCDSVGVIIDCDDITFEVINFGDSFAGASALAVQYDQNNNMASSGFDAGGADNVIMVRLGYRHNFVFPLLGAFLGDDTSTNSANHISTVVLRTEPYEF